MGISAAHRTKPVFRYVRLSAGAENIVLPITRDTSLILLPRGGCRGVGIRRRTAQNARYRETS